MQAEFHLNADDLNANFIQSLKSLFKGKKLSIIVESEIDETSYLLSTKANKQALLQSIKEVENGNVVKVSLKDLLKKKK